jgi:hypothetical protein
MIRLLNDDLLSMLEPFIDAGIDEQDLYDFVARCFQMGKHAERRGLPVGSMSDLASKVVLAGRKAQAEITEKKASAA